MLDEISTLAGSLLGDLLTPSLREAATDEVLALLPALRRLPRRLDRITMALEHGNLSRNVRLFADQRDAGFVAGLLNRAIMAFVGATLGIMSVVLLSIRGGPMLLPASAQGSGTSVFRAFGYLGLFFSFVLILCVIIAIAREGIG
jgi:ubiquinone biosynthesis protein